jgi:hypothetical protein
MSARVEATIQRFYEDADLRDELTDDEAQHLLRWAETELSKVDAASADDATFEVAAGTLSSLIKSINRFIGRRGYTTPEEQAAAFAKISAHAQALGYPLPADAFTPSFEAQAATDNVAALQALLSQIESSASPADVQTVSTPEAPETPEAPAEPPAAPPAHDPPDTDPSGTQASRYWYDVLFSDDTSDEHDERPSGEPQ